MSLTMIKMNKDQRLQMESILFLRLETRVNQLVMQMPEA